MERDLLVRLLLGCATWQLAIGEIVNLLSNPSFEDDLTGNWASNGFTMERHSLDSYHGSYSIKCSGRDSDLKGPLIKEFTFVKGGRYVFSARIKLLDDGVGKLTQLFKVILSMNLPDQVSLQSYTIAYRAFAKSSLGWYLIKGSLDAPMKDITNPKLIIRGPDASVEFLVDDVWLYEIPENENWKAEGDTNIENHRKNNILFNVKVPKGVPLDNIELEIKLKRHRFIFGAKIEEYELNSPVITEYEKLMLNMFNMATVQSYKWKFNRDEPDGRNFSRATEATDYLLSKGMWVRAHSLFWDVEKNVPDWVKAIATKAELKSVLDSHIQYMMSLTKGKTEQFDIQNELIHGRYYEERFQEPNISKTFFVKARAEDSDMDLYLNDFTCITSGASTEDMHDLGQAYVEEGIPLQGLGVQGHTKDFVKPDPTSMNMRIDRLAETGLDLMMTEFDIGWEDAVERADWFEDAIRTFFGHPKMKGMILWVVWNFDPKHDDHELVAGPDSNHLTLVESGERWICLTQKEWTTKVTKKLERRGTSFSVRAFQGDYEVIVKKGGTPVQQELFTLDKTDKTVNIAVTASTDAITVTEKFDYVPLCKSHRGQTTLTTVTTTSTDPALGCRTVSSTELSGTEETNSVSVTCDTDEVMTACTGFQEKGVWSRLGEKMEVNALGQIQCTAFNGRDIATTGRRRKRSKSKKMKKSKQKAKKSNKSSKSGKSSKSSKSSSESGGGGTPTVDGVRAYARCCKVAGLTCDYRTAGPSLSFDGAMAEARCADGQKALGCSVYQRYPDSDGVKPSADISSCLAQTGDPVYASVTPAERSGAFAFASCCSATQMLDCTLKESAAAGSGKGAAASSVCDAGYTMTGCSVFAESGKSAGATIVTAGSPLVTTCSASNGADLPTGSPGVKTFATCCKVA